MTAIDRTKIPDAALLSMQHLLSWAATAADEMYRALPMVRESPEVLSRLISTGIFTDLDNINRHSVRFNTALNADVNSRSLPLWEQVRPLTTPVAIPPHFLKP